MRNNMPDCLLGDGMARKWTPPTDEQVFERALEKRGGWRRFFGGVHRGGSSQAPAPNEHDQVDPDFDGGHGGGSDDGGVYGGGNFYGNVGGNFDNVYGNISGNFNGGNDGRASSSSGSWIDNLFRYP